MKDALSADVTDNSASPITIDLSGVPETMLWPLWNRGVETRRSDRVLADPMAVDLVEQLDYDFPGHFRSPSVFHSIRARVCDDLIRSYLSRDLEDPVVISLGEGLDSQLWRLDDERLRWVSVDVPEAIRVRERLLPSHPRASNVACSALDPDWMDAVPADAKPCITAAGLLMYFTEQEVRSLLTRISARFRGAEIYFDTIPPYLSRKTLKGWKVTRLYTAPPMPWGITYDDIPDFLRSIPNLEPALVQTYADPYPKRTRLFKVLSYVRPIRRAFAGGLVHARVSLP